MRGLLGKKLSHSYSKVIHEKIDSKKYNLIETNELDSFFQEKAFKAINVTIPYKHDVIKYVDDLSDDAKETNTVNTIINNNGKLKGYNTDFEGLMFTLDYYGISLNDKVIGILGNGATSKTISYISRKEKAKKIYVFARNPRPSEYALDSNLLKEVEVLFNATPNGMYPNNNDDLIIDVNLLHKTTFVMDLIYNPLRSKLIIACQKKRIKAVNGLMMLVHQAVKANEIFNSTTHDKNITLNIYKELLLETLNIVLIGMPMSGKSYFTRQINSVYSKEVIDIDNYIEDKNNKTIPEIFESLGEEGFRQQEYETVMDIYKLTNKAISTGGGIILNSKNIDLLKQNGLVIFLDTPLRVLKNCNPKGRPLLKDPKNLEDLYHKRYNLYNTQCDKRVVKRGFKRKETLSRIEVKINEYINS